jgi:hypothetical protein
MNKFRPDDSSQRKLNLNKNSLLKPAFHLKAK